MSRPARRGSASGGSDRARWEGTLARGIFVTGTDTGVGKTVIAAALAAACRARGLDVGVMKPVETGCAVRNGRRIARDARELMRAAGVRDGIEAVCPYRFKEPLAPILAAEREGAAIRLSRIAAAFRRLSRRHDFMIVEGIGGTLTPVTRAVFALDLALSFELPVLVVARTGLGTLNHTLLTVQAVRQAGAPVLGVVFNRARPGRNGLVERTNPGVFSRISDVPVLGVVPYLGGADRRSRLGGVGRMVMDHVDKRIHHPGIELDP